MTTKLASWRFLPFCGSSLNVVTSESLESFSTAGGLHNMTCASNYPDSEVHGGNMGPTWVLSAPDGPHVGPMNLVIRVDDVSESLMRNRHLPWVVITTTRSDDKVCIMKILCFQRSSYRRIVDRDTVNTPFRVCVCPGVCPNVCPAQGWRILHVPRRPREAPHIGGHHLDKFALSAETKCWVLGIFYTKRVWPGPGTPQRHTAQW